jgi:hypothetical protein
MIVTRMQVRQRELDKFIMWKTDRRQERLFLEHSGINGVNEKAECGLLSRIL